MSYAFDSEILRVVKNALKEDLGRGDITTRYFIPPEINVRAVIIAREKGIVCGLDIARLVFQCSDKKIQFLLRVKDGNKITKGEILAELRGLARGILTAERVALNFLSLLSGIATRTHKFVEMVRPYPVKIMDTRKTIPGLRKLEKYAVRIGGGVNHRFALSEMVLIKDNHLEVQDKLANRNLKDIIKNFRKKFGARIKIELEVQNFKEFCQTLKAEPDIIMLDNMSPREIKKAIRFQKKLSLPEAQRVKTEASGNITPANIRCYAGCGVDFISLGTLTKDVQSLDTSLEIL